MRRNLLLLVALISSAAAFTVHAAQQTAAGQDGGIMLQGARVERNGSTTSIRGNAIVKTDVLELHADEVDFNSDTRALEARGKVTVRSLHTSLTPQERLVLAGKQTELAELRTRFARTWPAVVRLEAEIAALEAQAQGSDWSMQTDMLKIQLPSAAPIQIRFF
jgi:hypothetical protein